MTLLEDENPILYTGTNRFGNRILGVIIEEDEDYSLVYFHILIEDKSYYQFVKQQVSLREIIKTNPTFIVNFQNDELRDSNLISYEEIPADYLPLEDSFCPEFSTIPSLDYGVSLKGKTADAHHVKIDDVNFVQASFGGLLQSALKPIQELGVNPRFFLEPAMASSYRVNYHIEFESYQTTLFHLDPLLIADYLKTFLNYIVSELPNETDAVLQETENNSQGIVVIEEKLQQLYKSSNQSPLTENLTKVIQETVNESALKFEDVSARIKQSSSFNKIEILNYDPQGEAVGIGLIDDSFYDSIKSKLFVAEKSVKEVIIEMDPDLVEYRILVYDLNIETGNCHAHFYPNESEENYKVKILIKHEDKSIHGSVISNSLDEQKVVTIRGQAQRIDGKVKSININL